MLEKLNEIIELQDIIKAFTIVYGNEYYDYINSCFNNMRIAWYNENEIRLENITSIEFESIKSQKICNAFLQSCYIDEFDLLVLPLKFDITQIIHEMNHKLGSHLISKKPLYLINGLCVDKEDGYGIKEENYNLSEIINQRITEEIIDELINMGYNISITESWQGQLFPLISSFYTKYSKLIKMCWIFGNIDGFKNTLGNEKYCNFTNYLYRKLFVYIRRMKKNEPITFDAETIDCIDNFVNNFNEIENSSKMKK